ncbi:intermembrane lipid transfer protein VPS13B isoform X2 [Cylas formicarius]|uniref:intermembrane lipid transfer protein VPS13B isoform X2 n=1 Tax=Cylas formicarius TaxID=197179 RepID=UPI002958891F|nr:intermembrane lipid transfer protein VPS13B isoform X2 [Cylas formicarius]
MFKVESYITPILLSYVNKYINNFRPEDSQVSLWGGDATFHNLELNLEVLEQELQLPFSFISGSIRELSIHVPWTRIASEPITITINTIECILNLKGKEGSSKGQPKGRLKDKKVTGQSKVLEAPPGYIQTLINKIVSNISIHCNNLILKYVEEDIVLSMNVKLLKVESANEKWESAYTDISPTQVILRKVISINDLTLCLDKRNASGKIEVYQEPMLYKCSMTMHLLRHYHSATAKRASTTRLDMYCNSMEFSMTEQQVPMLMRLLMLLYALQQRQLKQEPSSDHDMGSGSIDIKAESQENEETWSGWAWSYVSSVLPAPWDEDEWDNEQLKSHTGHSLHIGCYVDRASITFKVSESSSEKSYYSHKKQRYWPMLMLELQGMYSETIIHGLNWFNCMGGISEATLVPVGYCSCSHVEVNESTVPYLKLGSPANFHKTDSLFDADAVENKGGRREYNTSWDVHMTTNTESVLLERTPAFAFDYVYQMELPNDVDSDILSDLGSNYEYSNLPEASSLRLCVGPFRLRVCSGLFHRLGTLRIAASYYDYSPYYTPKPDLPLEELAPPSEEDFDALNEFIPQRSIRVTFFAPKLELELMDHLYFESTRDCLFRRPKKLSTTVMTTTESTLPKISVECQFIDVSMRYPMYSNRLVHVTCQLPEPPDRLFRNCYTVQNFKIVGLLARLFVTPSCHSIILAPSSMSYVVRRILKPQYWTKADIPHSEVTFESESFTVNGTKAKLLVVRNVIERMLAREPDPPGKSIYSSSLLTDAGKDFGFPCLELCIEGTRFRQVDTSSTKSIDVSLQMIQAFISESSNLRHSYASVDKNVDGNLASTGIQQVLFVSGPEPKIGEERKNVIPLSPSEISRGTFSNEDLPLLTATVQFPIEPETQEHPPVLIFNIQEIRICVDPLFCKFLLYAPKYFTLRNDIVDPVLSRQKSYISDASGSLTEPTRKFTPRIESVHSSSDKEAYQLPRKVPTAAADDSPNLQDRFMGTLKRWFDVWKGTFICGNMSQCIIYFPLVSLSAVGSRGIQETVQHAVSGANPPDVIVVTLPFANVKSAQRQNVTKYLHMLPISLPENVWTIGMCSFPWTISISELSCYTLQSRQKLIFLKPVSMNATIGLSTRSPKSDSTHVALPDSIDSSKSHNGFFGVCVHIDMVPIVFSTCETQIYLLASVLYSLLEVIGSFLPSKPKVSQKIPEIVPPILTKGSSTLSPTIVQENVVDSVSDKSPAPRAGPAEEVDPDTVKLTAWIQWTITKVTIELLANEDCSVSAPSTVKLVLDAEDIVSSLDFQNVYLKVKSKIGGASIRQFKRSTKDSSWELGPFSGYVMRLRDELMSGPRQEESSFISVTITRASCQHTHTLWGALQRKEKDKKLPGHQLSNTRYITEVVVNIQPLDFVLSVHTLRSFFYLALIPLSVMPFVDDKTEPSTTSNTSLTLNNQTLPLAYLECQDIRFIFPSACLSGNTSSHDVAICQIQKIALNPQAVNPICRTPMRPDIYDQAAHARVLGIPGSDIEDRQYQLDVTGISISTGSWDDMDLILSPSSKTLSKLRGLSENPALEWNNLEQGQPNLTPTINLRHIIEKFDISLVGAPAMMYKENTVICGHSVEINFVSDVVVNLSLQQVKLFSALSGEFVVPILREDRALRQSRIKFPYSRFDSRPDIDKEKEATVVEGQKDSGIETSDMKSMQSSKMQHSGVSVKRSVGTDKPCGFPRPSVPYVPMVPVEVVFTAGKIGVALHQANENKPTSAKHKGKRKKAARKTDEDQGYEASEESVDEKSDTCKKFMPLVFLSFTQPNAFFVKQQLGRRLQVTCFDFNLKISGPEYLPVNHLPHEDDYPISLLETRPGSPNPTNGTLPSFFTVKYSKGVGKTSKLELNVLKPTKVLCKPTEWKHMLSVNDRVGEIFRKSSTESVLSAPASSVPENKPGETNGKFHEIKELLRGVNSIAIRSDQIIFALKSDSDHEVHLGVQSLNSELSLSSRPEKLNLATTFESLTVTVRLGDFRKLLLNPWTISFVVCVFWESWQSEDSDPQLQVVAESDSIVVDVAPEQLEVVDAVTKDLLEFARGLSSKKSRDSILEEECRCPEKDQHYKDDLRAGAFQFVDSYGDSSEETPLPYQVMFWTKTAPTMAWKYPQPRALTKVRVFPVPYKTALGSQENHSALCHLEYWSESRNCYLPYTEFFLSESEVCHLNLPESRPKSVVASLWRVVITTDSTNATISPRALAACMRIDSYFNKTLIPNINVALYVTKIDICLYNHFSKPASVRLPECLKRYSSDLAFPENQKFFTLSLDSLSGQLSVWDLRTFSGEVSCSIQANVLDYNFLTDQVLVPPFTSKLEICLSEGLSCNFISRPVRVKFGPSIAHTLAVSTQVWNRSSDPDFVVVTRFVICNNTNVIVRFGQQGTGENVLLPPRYFHLYAWRSQKKRQQLKLSLEETDWLWSEPFSISEDGLRAVHFDAPKNITVFASVKSLSKTQKRVTLSGQLVVYNLLSEHFEMKVAESVTENKDFELKNAQVHIASAKCAAPSIFVDDSKKYFLRLRFYGLESAWTGDIPLREHLTGSQPWLVKVPLQERGQFLSIWCRIVVQEYQGCKRVLAMLWPLFMVKSNLPVNTKVHIETPTLGVHLESDVQGRGTLQQLYCPGTIDHSHQLVFKLEGASTDSLNPYVPLNYSLVDHQKFFKKPPKEDIDTILETLSQLEELKWPYFGEDFDHVDWITDHQPLSHIQVKYRNAGPYSCSLLVELIPWCLMGNTLGTSVALMLNGVELCRVRHHGMVAPPKLEENFHVGICTGYNWFFSGPLQLARSDWTQSFYMPKITGTIPIEGTTKTCIKCDSHLCMVLITSSLANEMRLLRFSSTHILSNYLSTQIQVICLAVPDEKSIFKIPSNVDNFCFTLAPHLQKNQCGIPIIKWYTLKQDGDSTNSEYTLYIAFSLDQDLGWSCPIRVDKTLIRKSTAIMSHDVSVPVVLTSQEIKGQIYMAIQYDPRPQLYIENRTAVSFYCGQAFPDDSGVTKESEHFRWHCRARGNSSVYYTMPVLSEKFPELPQVNYQEKLSLAFDDDDETDVVELEWSAGVNIANNNSIFVRVPHFGDVKVTVVNTACTTVFKIESVSQVEISAKDIRVRLSMREKETGTSQLASGGPQVSRQSSSSSAVGTDESDLENQISKDLSSLLETESLLVRTIPLQQGWKFLKLNVFVESFVLTLMSDLENYGEERWELASLVCDDVLVNAVQTEQLHMQISISDLQLDNQLYSRESYDFPVVLVGQERKGLKKLNILNVPIETLTESVGRSALVSADIVFDTWRNQSANLNFTGIKTFKLSLDPISCFIEDIYITRLLEYFKILSPVHLVLWPVGRNHVKLGTSATSVNVPEIVSWQCAILSHPLTVRNFAVGPISLLLSVHCSVKLYIALDQSPLQFGKFERRRLFSTHYRLGHALTMHYLSGAIFGAGWVVSSLELLGSPGGLARAMGTGLRDFVSLPYRGLVQGPLAFLKGITHGSASLMKHVTAGTLQSVTKLASSVARNLDRLTLDEEHQKRTEEQRRQRPQGVTQGFLQGMTSFGISLLGAVGGIAHHPLQSMMADGASPRSLVAGVGLGLVGVFTKPLSGAAELVALTGQGLLQGAGWNSLPDPRYPSQIFKINLANNSSLKYLWKLTSLPQHQVLYVTEATRISSSGVYSAVALVLTTDSVSVIGLEEDDLQKIVPLTDIDVNRSNDPTLLSLKLTPPPKQKETNNEDEASMEMDPVMRARVADYVRSTVGLLNLPDANSEHSDISISPLSSPELSPVSSVEECTVLNFYVSTHTMNYFVCLLNLAKQESTANHFSVL